MIKIHLTSKIIKEVRNFKVRKVKKLKKKVKLQKPEFGPVRIENTGDVSNIVNHL